MQIMLNLFLSTVCKLIASRRKEVNRKMKLNDEKKKKLLALMIVISDLIVTPVSESLSPPLEESLREFMFLEAKFNTPFGYSIRIPLFKKKYRIAKK